MQAFVREDLLEEIHHRLKFVDSYADNKLNQAGKGRQDRR